MPAILAASFVVCRWESSKYAGTVMTSASQGPIIAQHRRLACTLRTLKISAETSTGDFTPAAVFRRTMPGASSKRYGRFTWPHAGQAGHEALDRDDRVFRVFGLASLFSGSLAPRGHRRRSTTDGNSG